MIPADADRFRLLLEGLCATYRVEATRMLARGYWLGLRSLDMADVAVAFERALQLGGKFLPTPSELRGLIGQSIAAGIETAWQMLLYAIRVHGPYVSVDMTAPLNATVRSLGGWVYVCGLSSTDLHAYTRKAFERTYMVYVTRSTETYDGTPLHGLHSTKVAIVRQSALARAGEAIAKLPPVGRSES